MENAKLVDRLRYENDRFKTNYKLTNNRLPRQHDDLPPTLGDDFVRPDSYFSVAHLPKGDFTGSRSHSPAVGNNRSSNGQFGSMERRDDGKLTPKGSAEPNRHNSPFKLATMDGMISGFNDTPVSGLAPKPQEPLQIELHAFFKAGQDVTPSGRL